MTELHKKTGKVACRIAAFWLLCLLAVGFTDRVLDLKSEDVARFHRLHGLAENTADVLILGSSHAYCSYYTNEFWSSYGIAACVLSTSGQTMWACFHALYDALETQTPALVILEAYGITPEYEYEPRSAVFQSTRGLRWSENRIAAVKDAASPDEVTTQLLGFPVYHSRYKELKRDDFSIRDTHPDSKGTYFQPWTTAYDPPEKPESAEPVPPVEKEEIWYRRVIGLCRERGIPLIVMVAPFRYTQTQYGRLVHAARIAGEYGVPFLDLNENTEEAGIDYATCFADETHLNWRGGTALSRYTADYIASRYDLPDRRGDAAYDSWQRDADILERKIRNREARDAGSLQEVFERFSDASYLKILMFGGTCTDTEPALAGYLQALGADAYGTGGIRVVNGESVPVVCFPGEKRNLTLDGHDFYFRSDPDTETGGVANSVFLDSRPLPEKPEANGLTVTVYDMQLRETVLSAVTWKDNGYNGYQWTE